MIVAVLTVLLSGQTPYPQAAGAGDLYAPPAVRPFEPPSDFGRETAQGDGGTEVRRAPLSAAVAVDAYAGDYEATPTDGQTAYDQGVAQAEIAMDARMGPLDGRWRVIDAQGGPLMSLVLNDRGGRIEGAWAWGARTGAAQTAAETMSDGDVALDLGPAGRLLLRRRPAGDWAGRLVAPDGERPVILRRN